MRKFNLDEWSRSHKKVITRLGKDVIIVMYRPYDIPPLQKPVVFMLAYGTGLFTCTTDGEFFTNGGEACYDLFFKEEPPKYRPWKAEEVPLGCWIRTMNDRHRLLMLLVTVYTNGVIVFDGFGTDKIDRTYKQLLDIYEHSTDGGKTWLPCGVLES